MGKNWDKKVLEAECPTGKERDTLDVADPLTKSYQYRITKELALEYADITDDHCPWYYENSPFGAPICNPAIMFSDYVHVTVANGYKGVRTIHFSNNIELLYPPRQGRVVTVTARPLRKYEKRGRIWIDYYMEIIDDEGILLMRGEATEVITPLDRIKESTSST